MFSHVYGPLPKQLIGKPAIINLYGNKKAKAQEWVGADLHEVGKWGRGLMNTVYSANTRTVTLDLSDLVEDEVAPGRGWFPYKLPELLLKTFGQGPTVFDGYMGRGTVGRAAIDLGFRFVGIDHNPERVQLAREYLNI